MLWWIPALGFLTFEITQVQVWQNLERQASSTSHHQTKISPNYNLTLTPVSQNWLFCVLLSNISSDPISSEFTVTSRVCDAVREWMLSAIQCVYAYGIFHKCHVWAHHHILSNKSYMCYILNFLVKPVVWYFSMLDFPLLKITVTCFYELHIIHTLAVHFS